MSENNTKKSKTPEETAEFAKAMSEMDKDGFGFDDPNYPPKAPLKEISVVPGVSYAVLDGVPYGVVHADVVAHPKRDVLWDAEISLLSEGIEQQYIDIAKADLGITSLQPGDIQKMTREELIARNKENSKKYRRVASDEALAQPTTQVVNGHIYGSANFEGQVPYEEPKISGVPIQSILDTIECQKAEKQKRLEEMEAFQEARRRQFAKPVPKVPWYKKFLIAYTARFLAWLVR